MTAPAVDPRPRVSYVNRHTGRTTSALVRQLRASRAWECSCCGGEIRRGGLHWQTLNNDGRLCATCFVLNLDPKGGDDAS